MSGVQEIYQLTLEFHAFLQKADRKLGDRDQFIEEVNDFLEKRQLLLEQMKPPFTDKEKALGQQIASYDKENSKILAACLEEIKVDIRSLKMKKANHNKYESLYNQPLNDGIFLDKKK